MIENASNFAEVLALLNQLDADQIKQIIESLMPDHSEEADIVIDAAIEALQKKIDEKEFLEFLNLFT